VSLFGCSGAGYCPVESFFNTDLASLAHLNNALAESNTGIPVESKSHICL
jgi:hypothetical protein